jgi:uncharacterized membrane protein
LFGIAALLRCILAGERGLWADEIFSLAMATGHSLEHPAAAADPAYSDFVEPKDAAPAGSFGRYFRYEDPPAGIGRVIRAVLVSDTSPPLYYLLLHGWTRGLGTSDLALRLFSVLWALAAFPLLWSLGHRLGGHTAAASAATLYALAPASLFYSVEGRMYSMLWFLALAFIWLTVELHLKGTRRRSLFLWVITGAAGFFTHYFFVFVWSAGTLWLALYPGKAARLRLFAGAVVTAAITLPWYVEVPASLSRWRVTGSWLAGPLTWTQVLSAPVLLAWNLLAGRGIWGGSRWMDRLLAALLVVAAVAIWRRGIRPLLEPLPRLIWIWLLFVCVGPVVFDLVRGTFASLMARYALAAIPAAMLLLGLGLSRLRVRMNALLVALIVCLWIPGIMALFQSPRTQEPYVELGAELSKWAGEGDLIIVHSIPSGVLAVTRYMNAAAPVAAWIGQLGSRRTPQDLDHLLEGRRRVALVKVHHIGEPAPEEDWLRLHARLLQEWTLRSARILYFGPRAGATFGADTTAAASMRR